ncbi:Type II secretory pathway [Prochlorococcus marinus str. MIT 9201]|uniref:Type II secretory pathway n=1 Tax=Prochlorococcus marinus str. MIT 9201 TaxID=93057 RepID=A0A0A2A325_PROMR|nr:Type II secretory pathway [Prochlorococcus marinus str. MIT 9201]
MIPSLIEEINLRGLEINEINLGNTNRPIAGDKCWVINCEIKDTCNFWLSFEKEDISSLKSISLSKPNQKPSIIESFLIDEKRITLKLIISRVLQRLNGQKLIGVN